MDRENRILLLIKGMPAAQIEVNHIAGVHVKLLTVYWGYLDRPVRSTRYMLAEVQSDLILVKDRFTVGR